MRDHREIMADQDIGQAAHLLQISKQVEHFGLHRHV